MVLIKLKCIHTQTLRQHNFIFQYIKGVFLEFVLSFAINTLNLKGSFTSVTSGGQNATWNKFWVHFLFFLFNSTGDKGYNLGNKPTFLSLREV